MVLVLYLQLCDLCTEVAASELIILTLQKKEGSNMPD